MVALIELSLSKRTQQHSSVVQALIPCVVEVSGGIRARPGKGSSS